VSAVVRLSDWWVVLGTISGRQRGDNARGSRRRSKFDAKGGDETGALGEAGVAQWLNVFPPLWVRRPDSDRGDLRLPDGRWIEVRSRSAQYRNCPDTLSCDHKPRPYVFAEVDQEKGEVLVLGWLPGEMIPEVGRFEEVDTGGDALPFPCWWIPVDALERPEDLPR
jgi:hypothetical protein